MANFIDLETAGKVNELVIAGKSTRQIAIDCGIAKGTAMRRQAEVVSALRRPVLGGTLDFSALVTRGPAFMGDVRFNNLHWTDQQRNELKILCEGDAEIGKAASVLGRGEKAIAWRARDSGLSLPSSWAKLIAPKRIYKPREQRVVLSYPFIIKKRDEHADLLAVNSLVPSYLPGREDICQEIMLALWEKRITLDQLKAHRADLRAFVTAFQRKNFEMSGYAVSLDAPMADGRSWHEVLAAPEPDATTNADDEGSPS